MNQQKSYLQLTITVNFTCSNNHLHVSPTLINLVFVIDRYYIKVN